MKRLEPSDQGEDEAKKGKKAKTWSDVVKDLKIEDELVTANSDKSEDESETVDSVRMFDSDTLNQPRPKRKRRQQEKRQHRNSRRADKGRVSRHADRKGRSV